MSANSSSDTTRVFSRRFLLACGWGVCALLITHSAPTLIEGGLTAAGLRDAELSVLERWSLFVHEPWFFLGGVLYGVAVWCVMAGERRDRDGVPLFVSPGPQQIEKRSGRKSSCVG